MTAPDRHSMEVIVRAWLTGAEVIVETKGFLPTASGPVTEFAVRRTDGGLTGHVQVGSANVPLHVIVNVRQVDDDS